MKRRGILESANTTEAVNSHADQHQTSAGDGAENNLSHPPEEWAEIQPRFKHLYINLDMTLRDCMGKIEAEYNFHASVQMYKKRIKAWGLSKTVKAKHKDQAIADLIQCRASARGNAKPRPSIRHDKILRHAQSRVKAGQLDPALFRQLQAYIYARPTAGITTQADNPLIPCLIKSQHPVLPISQHPLANPLAKFDLFLRACRTVIHKERTEWHFARTTGTSRLCPETIVHAFIKGMHHLSHSDFTSARICFSTAAQTFVADLQQPSGPVMSRMIYFVGAPVWDRITNPVALQFRDFMVSAATEILGKGNPLTIMFEGLGITQSMDMQLAVWAAAMDLYQEIGAAKHMYGMARQRWIWCRGNGLIELAAWYRSMRQRR